MLRRNGNDLPSETRVAAIPGALAIDDQRMLAPTRTFARPILGTVGEATKEIVDASSGAVVGGDQVGLSGLQRRYDAYTPRDPGRTGATSTGEGRRLGIAFTIGVYAERAQ